MVSANHTAPATVPEIVIPADVEWCPYNGWSFDVKTDTGDIHVHIAEVVKCLGSPSALTAASILNPDFIPAKTSQTIHLTDSGPKITEGGRGKPKANALIVQKYPGDRLCVKFLPSALQRSLHAEMLEDHKERNRRERASYQQRIGDIEFEQDPRGYWKSWTGTRDALIEMEVCRADQFPDGRKRRIYGDDWSMQRNTGGIYTYCVHVPSAEVKPPRGLEYASTESWRSKAISDIRLHLAMCLMDARGDFEKHRHGETTMRFDDETLDQINEAMCDLIDVLEAGRVVHVGQQSANQASVAARQDQTLQAFLASIRSK